MARKIAVRVEGPAVSSDLSSRATDLLGQVETGMTTPNSVQLSPLFALLSLGAPPQRARDLLLLPAVILCGALAKVPEPPCIRARLQSCRTSLTVVTTSGL